MIMHRPSFPSTTWIRQDNKLVDSSYCLTVTEMRLVWHLIGLVQPGDTNFSEYEFSASELGQMIGKPDIAYAEAEAIIMRLWRREVHITNGGQKLSLRWICEAIRNAESGLLRISISPTMRPFLLQLKEWTQAKLEQLCSLSSRYAVRLYLWACKVRNQQQKTWTTSVEELRASLEIPSEEYVRFNDFNAWVLRKPIAEVNSQTDLKLDYQILRRARTPYAVRFIIVEGEPTSTGTGELVHAEKIKRIKQRARAAKREKVNQLHLLPNPKEISAEERAAALEQIRHAKQVISEIKSYAN